MKTPAEMVDDLLKAAQPPSGYGAQIRQVDPADPTDSSEANWDIVSGAVWPEPALTRLMSALKELKRQHPRLEWDPREGKTATELSAMIREMLNSPNTGMINVLEDRFAVGGWSASVMTYGSENLQSRVSEIAQNLAVRYRLKKKP